jgi:hypothetical protein
MVRINVTERALFGSGNFGGTSEQFGSKRIISLVGAYDVPLEAQDPWPIN